jgi:hypothetical protein
MTTITMAKPDQAPGQAWLEIVKRPTLEAFATAFAKNVVLDSSVAAIPFVGAAAVWRFFEVTRTMYERIAFTHETRAGLRTCLEWEGTFEGRDVAGATVLTRNAAGMIESIRLYHRPYDLVLAFSTELARRLG